MPLLNMADNVFLGSSQVGKIYLGSNLVWEKEIIVVNPNLITNGDFSDGLTTGWSASNGGILSVVDGTLKMVKGSSSNCFCYQAVPVLAGKTYEISVEVVESPQNTGVRLGTGPAQLQYLNSGAVGPRVVTLSHTPSVNETIYLSIVYVSTVIGDFGRYDNISIVEA